MVAQLKVDLKCNEILRIGQDEVSINSWGDFEKELEEKFKSNYDSVKDTSFSGGGGGNFTLGDLVSFGGSGGKSQDTYEEMRTAFSNNRAEFWKGSYGRQIVQRVANPSVVAAWIRCIEFQGNVPGSNALVTTSYHGGQNGKYVVAVRYRKNLNSDPDEITILGATSDGNTESLVRKDGKEIGFDSSEKLKTGNEYIFNVQLIDEFRPAYVRLILDAVDDGEIQLPAAKMPTPIASTLPDKAAAGTKDDWVNKCQGIRLTDSFPVSRYKHLVAGPEGVFYGITSTGIVDWYKHDGWKDGALAWQENMTPRQIHSSFGPYVDVLATSDGVLYGVTAKGDVYWHKHLEPLSGGNRWKSNPERVGKDWKNYKLLRSSSAGAFYWMWNDGRIDWYRHENFASGKEGFVNGGNSRDIGKGFKTWRMTVGPNGNIFEISSDYKLRLFQHLDLLDAIAGEGRWENSDGVVIGENWKPQILLAGQGGTLYEFSATGKIDWYRYLKL